MIYTGPFDLFLGDGVSATFFDLLTFFKKEGYDTKIVTCSHSIEQTRRTKQYIESHIPENIVYKDKTRIIYTWDSIEIDYALFPVSRENVLVNSHPSITNRYKKVLLKYPNAVYFTSDHDINCFILHELFRTKSFHFIHSPVAFAEFIQSVPAMNWILTSLRQKIPFTNSLFSQEYLRAHTGMEARYWPPYIEKERYVSHGQQSRRLNKIIGFYNAGPHKGGKIVHSLMDQLPEYTFKIMGYRHPIPSRPHVQFHEEPIGSKRFYSDLSLLIVPSMVPEGYSRVIMEAFMNGIPVIANKVGGIPEAAGKAGILVDSDQKEEQMVREYVDHIHHLLHDELYYETLSQRSLEHSEGYHRMITHLNTQHMIHFFR